MATINLDDTDGTILLKMKGQDDKLIDVFLAHDAFATALDGWIARNDGTPEEKLRAVNDWYDRLKAATTSLGILGISGTTAERIRQGVEKEMDTLRGKADAGSPAPTP